MICNIIMYLFSVHFPFKEKIKLLTSAHIYLKEKFNLLISLRLSFKKTFDCRIPELHFNRFTAMFFFSFCPLLRFFSFNPLLHFSTFKPLLRFSQSRNQSTGLKKNFLTVSNTFTPAFSSQQMINRVPGKNVNQPLRFFFSLKPITEFLNTLCSLCVYLSLTKIRNFITKCLH
jgi:hypothetical protein